MLNAILSVVRGGNAWRMLPHDLPPYGIVYHYVRQWRLDGTWHHINTVLRGEMRVLERRHRQPSAGSMDAQSVKTTDRGGIAGFDGSKGVKGRKRHLLVDVLGLLLAVVVTDADVQDRAGARSLLGILRHRLTWLRCIWADGAYTGSLAAWVYELRTSRRVRLEIIKRSEQAKGFTLLPKRWVVDRFQRWLTPGVRHSAPVHFFATSSKA